MALTNHLKNNEASRAVLAWASGRHVFDGHLVWSKTEGTSPSHRLVLRQALGEVWHKWDSVEGVWYEGLNVASTDYIFSNGTQVAATSFFPTDTEPHTGTALLDVKGGTGVGEADTKTTTPELARIIAKTETFPDFDASGNQVTPGTSTVLVTFADLLSGTALNTAGFAYTASPARVVVGWMLKKGISIARINWTKWVAWRDYCATTESVDYTTITDFEGIGLSAAYYSGSNFGTLLWTRIDPVVNFLPTLGVPALGLPADDFSVRWEGKIKAQFTGTVTFKVVHDNGVRLTVNGVSLLNIWQTDGEGPYGTDSATISLTAGQFYTILAEWNEGLGGAEFSLRWSWAGHAEEVIPQKYLYPKATNNARYEAHVAFSTPTTLDQMIASVLMVSNSIKQDVDGMIEFYCVEQLSSTFAFTETNGTIEDDGSFKFYRSDVRDTEVQNVFEATFRDLDSQYLEEPAVPIREEAEDLLASAEREIYGNVIDLFNMTRWQARKVLKYIVDRAARKDMFVEFNASALAYKVIAGDVVTLTHARGNFVAKEFMVIEAIDQSPEETADVRYFKLQEWN